MAKANKLLTSKHLQTLFAVSHMAIQHWRKGSDKREPLPVTAVDDNPRAIGFAPAQVKAWAKKHGLTMTVADPASLLGSEPEVKPAKPVAKKAATAIHQKPAKKASPLKGTKVAAAEPAKPRAPRRAVASEAQPAA